ncbi:hypothetical protein PLICRDRAFT_46427 [Plicaturopsis crispa FD-325 SS-3]|uniref:Uncharacterized protein n=1 Tax=Plicaturopsis crispa FD-325 SS-3 TaxID=944288 RepID=A0A0C9T446_PLICR|nr:hypothetical protein PLICRDRAFT_46427 [Plicaturopsis crispa FD-325 SS-3]
MGDFGAPIGRNVADWWCEYCGGNDPDQQQDRARTWTMAPNAQDYGYQREGAPAEHPHYAYGAYPPYMRQPEPDAWYYPSAEEYARYDMHNTR